MKFIYLFRAGAAHYKVGITGNIANRIKAIQTSNQHQIELITSRPVSNDSSAEKELHDWLKDYRTNGGSEWFELTTEQALELVKKISSIEVEADITDHLNMRNLMIRQDRLEQKLSEYIASVRPPKKVAKTIEPNMTNDILLPEATQIATLHGGASASLLQRRLRIGYARAARLLDLLETNGIVGPSDGARKRELLIAYK